MWWERKGHLDIQDNKLLIANQKVSEIVQNHGTPLYIYNLKRVIENYRLYDRSLREAGFNNYRIHYALKSNNHTSIVKTIRDLGGGIDASSPGEVEFARKNGFDDSQIICTGTSLSNTDLDYLLNTDVIINIDSISSLRRMNSEKGRRIGLRINPGIGMGRTKAMTTGGSEIEGSPVKFGLPIARISEALEIIKEKQLQLYCLHHHVGSDWLAEQIPNYLIAFDSLLETSRLIQERLGYSISVLDLGGGFGVPHSENEKEFPFQEFFDRIAESIAKSQMNFSKIIIEPGNSLVSDAGILVAQTNTVEKKGGHLLVGIDAGLNVFNSPALYGIYHEIIVCNRCHDSEMRAMTVVGNICESGDIFALKRKLPAVREGDYLAILNAGAYGAVMSSTYNLRPMAKELILE